MTTRSHVRAALAGLALLSATPTGYASAKDFEFQPVTIDVKNGEGAELSVRLIDKRTGKLVANAVIFRTRLDMSPDGMDEMEAKHGATPATEPGVYSFKADLTMAGGWALKLQAKVPGEAETIEGSVIFQAKD
ncbi:MAG: FixH family protein [Hyphomicrobium sp.]